MSKPKVPDTIGAKKMADLRRRAQKAEPFNLTDKKQIARRIAARDNAKEGAVVMMPWVNSKPPRENKHTLRAQKLDRKSDQAAKRGNYDLSARLERRADKAARKGGWW